MNQLTQTLKTGEMRIVEAPPPVAEPGLVVVRNAYSLISAGTEASKVTAARKGYIGKALERPEQLRQVLANVRTEGLLATYGKVMKRLEAPAPLGYSSAGQVLAVGPGVRTFHVGDWVACGGAGACHAEVVAVEENLCARLPGGVEPRDAAFTTVGAIALQGIRQADLRLGENCAVIGLGLIGQLTIRLLREAGVRTLGIDINPAALALAKQSGAASACLRTDPGLDQAVHDLSGPHGLDAVIITAGSSSTDPVDLAGKLCRRKGKVVIVGAVPTGFSRTAYYEKELELRMSCSYGPGRYDAHYEEKGLDYPIGYVRWTENRNMQAFLELAPRLRLNELVSHEFAFTDALKAYDLIVNRTEPYVGVVLKYAEEPALSPRVSVHLERATADKPRIGFIGAGSFARSYLLPTAAPLGELVGVATSHPHSARHVAERHGFAYAATSAEEILDDPKINTIFVATRHDLHARFVLAAIKRNKHVFVEKPLCLTAEELEAIQVAQAKSSSMIMVGFNRRFAPLIRQAVDFLGPTKPCSILYRVNAGAVPGNHWMQDPAVGGGRILGEGCHFIDLACFLAGGALRSLSACALRDGGETEDCVAISLGFANGSIAGISYISNAAPRLPKEYLEVSAAGTTAVVHDFRALELLGAKESKRHRATQDKGHRSEVGAFLEAVRTGAPAPIPFADIAQSSRATLDVLTALRNNATVLY